MTKSKTKFDKQKFCVSLGRQENSCIYLTIHFTGQRPLAIVSPIAGTTRDIVESAFDFGGYPILLSDTAGLRETEDPVENEGVRRALDRAQTADLILLVLDASTSVEQYENRHAGSIDEHLQSENFVKTQLETFGVKLQPEQKVLVRFVYNMRSDSCPINRYLPLFYSFLTQCCVKL